MSTSDDIMDPNCPECDFDSTYTLVCFDYSHSEAPRRAVVLGGAAQPQWVERPTTAEQAIGDEVI